MFRAALKSIYGLDEANTAIHMGHVEVLQEFQFNPTIALLACRKIQEMIVHLEKVKTAENSETLQLVRDMFLTGYAIAYGTASEELAKRQQVSQPAFLQPFGISGLGQSEARSKPALADKERGFVRPKPLTLYGLSETDTATHMGHVAILQEFQFDKAVVHLAGQTIQNMIIHLHAVATPENTRLLASTIDMWLASYSFGHYAISKNDAAKASQQRYAAAWQAAKQAKSKPRRSKAAEASEEKADAIAEPKPDLAEEPKADTELKPAKPQAPEVSPELAAARAALAKRGKLRGPAIAKL